jgi:hypothetical protein
MSTERALADAFVLAGLRHATDPEMRNAARLHANWCRGHLDALQRVGRRHGAERRAEGQRLRRALFRGPRVGGVGLVRDVHDLLTLAASVHGCWTALRQAAREQRDEDLEAVCRACDTETVRQIAWLETKLRHAAPQALTVSSPPGRELMASIPDHHQIGALADLVPGPGIRAMLPLAPVAAVVLLLAAVWLAPGPGRRSGRGS